MKQWGNNHRKLNILYKTDKREKFCDILDVKINTEKKSAILRKVEDLLKDGKQHYLVTPNPEIIMYAKDHSAYVEILNGADLKLADGIGLKLASYFTKNKIKQRIKGVDFVEDLCYVAQENNYPVFLLGGKDFVAKKAAKKLLKKFPQLNINVDDGGRVNSAGLLEDENVINFINRLKPKILFVGFGFPKQEKFIIRYLNKMSSVRLAIGVGGAFNFISGEIRRAPKFLQKIGLEWLWRLIIQPKRSKRIYTATIEFPLTFLRWKIQHNFKNR